MSAIFSWPRARRIPTVAALLRRLGDVPPDRVRTTPPPGTATEADLIQYSTEDDTLYELVSGTLVEKAAGIGESKLTIWLLSFLHLYLQENLIGELSGPDGFYRLRGKLVRAPDIAFCTWESTTTEEEDVANPIADACPDLAVEVISPSNTPEEMALKRKEFFKAGTRLIWQVYPLSRTVEVYTSPRKKHVLKIGDVLNGGDVLPGFQLPVQTLFGRRPKPGPGKKA